MTEALLQQIAGTGLVGGLFVLVLIQLYRERREAKLERERVEKAWADETRARIEDAKLYGATLREMQAKLTDTVASLADVTERRELQRELIDAVTRAGTIVETIEKVRDADGRGPFSRQPR